MKKTVLLLTAAMAPLTLFAQSPPTGGAEATSTPAPALAPRRIPQVHFQDASLAEVVEHLQEVSERDDADPLNVVISPGLETQRIPGLSLRNVSPTEVLTVVTTVLGLRMDPVPGDEGQTVAWLVKRPEPVPGVISDIAGVSGGTVVGGGIGVAGTAVAGADSPPPPVQLHVTPSLVDAPSPVGGPEGPFTVLLADSSPSGTQKPAPPRPAAQVFGVAPLIASQESDPKARKKEQDEKLERLITVLDKMAREQDGEASIKAYGAMDIIVVRSADPATLKLIAEAIEAMKLNDSAASTGHSAERDAREHALRAELDSLRAKLDIAIAEREMTKRTYTDQLDLFKAANKAGNPDRKTGP